MKTDEKTRHIREVPAGGDIMAHRPFRVEHEKQRRFVRLQISAPMSLNKIKDHEGNFFVEGDWHTINGMVLNISAGGVLVELDQAVYEGEVVSMHFTLQEVEGLNNVLGLIKRVDVQEDCIITGIEFINKDYLIDHFSDGELNLLGEEHADFDDSVKQVLNKYVYNVSESRESK